MTMTYFYCVQTLGIIASLSQLLCSYNKKYGRYNKKYGRYKAKPLDNEKQVTLTFYFELGHTDSSSQAIMFIHQEVFKIHV